MLRVLADLSFQSDVHVLILTLNRRFPLLPPDLAKTGQIPLGNGRREIGRAHV